MANAQAATNARFSFYSCLSPGDYSVKWGREQQLCMNTEGVLFRAPLGTPKLKGLELLMLLITLLISGSLEKQ